MRYIQIDADERGAHANQYGGGHPGDGWAVVPDEIEIPDTFPFVSITVADGEVTSMTAGTVPPKPEITPEPTPYDILRADVDFIMAMEGYIQ